MGQRIVFGVTGATGIQLAEAVLAAFATVPDLETHLIVSRCAERVLEAECGATVERLTRYAARVHDAADMAAGPASGSWRHGGMIICPCSMSTLATIANGCGQNLIHRAADVCLKERRPLVLAARETPFSLIHIKNMQAVTEAGAIVMPFMPAFYSGETKLETLMRNFAGRLLDQLRLPHNLCTRWRGDR